MTRDIVLLLAVLVSVASLGIGVYQHIEAGNAKGFTYEQAYRLMDVIQRAPISGNVKADMLSAALNALATPPPVIDLSQSHADTPVARICDEAKVAACSALAVDLAGANTDCRRNKNTSDSCNRADALRKQIITNQCIACYPH